MNSVCGDGGISISAHFFVQLLLQRKKRKAELYGKRSDDLAHFLKKRLPVLIKSRTGKNKRFHKNDAATGFCQYC